MAYTKKSLTEACEEILVNASGMNLPAMVNSSAIELFRCNTGKKIFPEIAEAIDDLHNDGYFRFADSKD